MELSMKELLTRNPFTIAWLSWIVMFFFIEGMAIWSDVSGATLSSHIRDWLRNRDTWVIVLAWIFMLALTAHYLVDLKRGQ